MKIITLRAMWILISLWLLIVTRCTAIRIGVRSMRSPLRFRLFRLEALDGKSNFSSFINRQHLHLDLLPDLKKIIDIIHVDIRDLGDVNESHLVTLELNESAELRDTCDNALYNGTNFNGQNDISS